MATNGPPVADAPLLPPPVQEPHMLTGANLNSEANAESPAAASGAVTNTGSIPSAATIGPPADDESVPIIDSLADNESVQFCARVQGAGNNVWAVVHQLKTGHNLGKGFTHVCRAIDNGSFCNAKLKVNLNKLSYITTNAWRHVQAKHPNHQVCQSKAKRSHRLTRIQPALQQATKKVKTEPTPKNSNNSAAPDAPSQSTYASGGATLTSEWVRKSNVAVRPMLIAWLLFFFALLPSCFFRLYARYVFLTCFGAVFFLCPLFSLPMPKLLDSSCTQNIPYRFPS